jgi:AraC-like DNA-binding protein
MAVCEFAFGLADEPQRFRSFQESALDVRLLELLHQQIRSQLKNGYPSIDPIAHAVAMSPRSLQHQLAKNYLSYSLLINQVRFKEAVSLLQDSTLSLIEISLELGYNDAASFTRAFKQ